MTNTSARDLRQLRAALKEGRERLKLTQRDVAEALDWSPSKVIRIEKGTVGISITDLKALLLHYGTTDPAEVQRLVELARASKQPAWWDKYRDFYPQQFLTFLGLEAASIGVHQFQGLVVPGLLQTPDYARVLVSVESQKIINQHLDIRLRRQEPLKLGEIKAEFILDESVLYRMIGRDPQILKGQLIQLKERAALPNVKIQILPFSAGKHRGMGGSFHVITLSKETNDYAVLLEGISGDTLIEEISDETKEYFTIFQELKDLALSEDETSQLIDKALARLDPKS